MTGTSNMINESINLLGYRATDKVSKVTGVITSMSFDISGCIQAAVHQGVDKDGKMKDIFWFDIARLNVHYNKGKVLEAPYLKSTFQEKSVETYDKGPAEKPTVQDGSIRGY